MSANTMDSGEELPETVVTFGGSSRSYHRLGEYDQVGRELLCSELGESRREVESAFRSAEETLAVLDDDGRYTGNLDAADIIACRRALNRARRVVENYAVRVTDDVKPWGQPVPDIPYGRLYDEYGIERPGATDE